VDGAACVIVDNDEVSHWHLFAGVKASAPGITESCQVHRIAIDAAVRRVYSHCIILHMVKAISM
jgi:hypothetical protein